MPKGKEVGREIEQDRERAQRERETERERHRKITGTNSHSNAYRCVLRYGRDVKYRYPRC